jgi:pimeloyl-ACP methyl ester carboxylesterase
MPVIRVHGTDLYYEDTGGSGETILFLHGFLFDGRQYEAQIAALRDRYRCLTLDFRGQGRSAANGGYQIEQHTADVLALIRELDLAPLHLAGLSMGGFVGLRIAAREPGMLQSLMVLNSSAAAHARTKIAKHMALSGVGRVVGVSPPRLLARIEAEMYGEAFRADPARSAERETWRKRWAESDRSALTKTLRGVMFRPDIRTELADITIPVLIIAGGADSSLPPQQSEQMHQLIAGSRLVELPGVGHSSPVEDPAAVTHAMEEFLGSVRARAQDVP